jgi:signal transduction histidine kinase
VRHLAAQALTVSAVPRWKLNGNGPRADLPVRLHDVATGLAIGIGLFKGFATAPDAHWNPDRDRALELFEESLASLRKLTATSALAVSHRGDTRTIHELLIAESSRLKMRLEFELAGREAWLAPNDAELILLVARESLRNISRHSGARACRISLDLTTCPYVMRVRDWGGGVQAGARPGNGIALLQVMAAEMGCELSVGSQPGLGTELVLIGPTCARDRTHSSTGSGGEIRSRIEDGRRR